MTELAHQILTFALGWTGFSVTIWLMFTGLLLLGGAVLTAVAAPVIDPIAVELVVRPGRVQRWLPISLLGSILLFMLLIVTIVGSPLAVIFAFACGIGAFLGYIALSLVVGNRIATRFGWKLSPWQLTMVGIILIRLVRLIPYAGGVLSLVWLWIAYAAMCAVAWDHIWSWHKRRLPDDVQFKDESNLIEWEETPLGKAGRGLPDGYTPPETDEGEQ